MKNLKRSFLFKVKDVLVFNQSLFIQFLEQKNYLNDSYTAYKNKVGLKEQKQHLVELLDKNQLYVNLSLINDKDFEVSAGEKRVTQDFYQLKKS